MPRKKKNIEVAIDNNESTNLNAVDENSNGNANDEYMSIFDFIEFAKDHDNAEIKQFIKDNNILSRAFVPFEELEITAQNIIRDTCFDQNGNFKVNTPLLEMYKTVYNFVLYVMLDFKNIKFVELYDVIREYDLENIMLELILESHGDKRRIMGMGLKIFNSFPTLVNNMIDDIKYNDYSVEASMRKISSDVSSLITKLNDGVQEVVDSDDLSTKIASAIVDEVKNGLNN